MKFNVIPIETDVLIIGGGLGGCMSAIKASEHGLNVIIAEKANTTHSGSAGNGIDHIWAYCPPVHGKMGWTINDMFEDHTQAYDLVDKDLFYLVASTMYDRILDLEKFGINFRYEDSKIPGKFRIVPQFHSVPTSFNFDGRDIKKRLTEQAIRRRVNIINRVMITDLISTDGQISGALGLSTRTMDIYFFKAKAIVLSTGRSNRLGRHDTGIDYEWRAPGSLSGDGKSMALKAGLELINMEFLTPSTIRVRNYHQTGGPSGGVATWYPASDVIDSNGKILFFRDHFYDWEKHFKEKIDATESRRKWLKAIPLHRPGLTKDEYIKVGPLYGGCSKDATDYEIDYIRWSNSNEGKCYRFATYHLDQEMNFNWARDRIELGPTLRELSSPSANGVVVDKNLETKLKGLFAVGDEVGGLPWSAAPGAVVMGWHAGEMAAKHAGKMIRFLPVSKGKLESLEESCSNMLSRKGGFYWREVELTVQNILDLNCNDIRTEAMLRRGIDLIKEVRGAPMRAENVHELIRSLEVKSIIDNCEMIMRASLERRESRKRPVRFERADFPEQDHKNYFAFLALRLEGGEFKFSKIPINH